MDAYPRPFASADMHLHRRTITTDDENGRIMRGIFTV